MNKSHFAVNFYIKGFRGLFARRILTQVPEQGSFVVFNEVRYIVKSTEWCLDEDATNYEHQALVNVELLKQPSRNIRTPEK